MSFRRMILLPLLALLPGCGISEAKCKAIGNWAASLQLSPGSQRMRVALPADLAPLSADGTVDMAMLASGRLCFVLKRSIGYKDNWSGIAWCDGPLDASALNGNTMTLGDPPLEEIFVRRRRAPHRFDVYFDLN